MVDLVIGRVTVASCSGGENFGPRELDPPRLLGRAGAGEYRQRRGNRRLIFGGIETFVSAVDFCDVALFDVRQQKRRPTSLDALGGDPRRWKCFHRVMMILKGQPEVLQIVETARFPRCFARRLNRRQEQRDQDPDDGDDDEEFDESKAGILG